MKTSTLVPLSLRNLAAAGLLFVTAATASGYTFQVLSNPDRTLVYDGNTNWVATLTTGARKGTLAGPSRTFSESGLTYTVSHAIWVRTLPSPYDGTNVNT